VPDICYLCGREILDDATRDHVPPLQFFASSLRRVVNLDRLVTTPAHLTCNRSYGADEEYFVWALSPLATGTTAGDAITRDNAAKFRTGRNVKLGAKVLKEFEERPSGLYLPHGKSIKRLDGERIKRVIWKIVRGLYFLETSTILPEETMYSVELISPFDDGESDLSEIYEMVKARPSKGAYPGVFDYKYLDARTDAGRIHVWGMLLWDKIMVFVAHFHPGAEPPRPAVT